MMRTLSAVCGFLFLLACEEKKAPSKPTFQAEPAATAPASAPDALAKEVFNTRCSTCHGATGKGDGVAAAALNPKPRNMTDKAWQKSVDDAQIKKTIVEGGQAVGKSPLMAANPDLKDKPEVLNELVKIVRAFGN